MHLLKIVSSDFADGAYFGILRKSLTCTDLQSVFYLLTSFHLLSSVFMVYTCSLLVNILIYTFHHRVLQWVGSSPPKIKNIFSPPKSPPFFLKNNYWSHIFYLQHQISTLPMLAPSPMKCVNAVMTSPPIVSTLRGQVSSPYF